VIAVAAREGALDVLVWLRSQGCPWDERVYEWALAAGHLHVVAYAKKNGCPYALELHTTDNRVLYIPMRNCTREVFLVEMGIRFIHQSGVVPSTCNEVTLDGNDFTELPDGMLHTGTLSIRANRNPRLGFPASLARAPNARELGLSRTGTEGIPPVTMEQLDSLELRHNPICQLPETFGHQFPMLRCLDLTGCELRTVPEALRASQHLTCLYLAGNYIHVLPEWLSDLSLEILSVAENFLTTVPTLPISLVRLFLQLNKELEHIENVGELVHLVYLNVAWTQLKRTSIPGLSARCQLFC
jgi:hypothetical protein